MTLFILLLKRSVWNIDRARLFRPLGLESDAETRFRKTPPVKRVPSLLLCRTDFA